MENIVGPLGFSDKDPQGFLLKGFDDPMTVMVTNCSFDYMIPHTERNGFKKKLDLFQYRVQLEEKTADIYIRIAERATARGFKIVAFTKSKEIKPYVKTVFNLINETYTDIYGFALLDDREATEFSNRFLPLLNPNYIKLVKDKNDEVVAFVVAMPNISEGFKKANGRILPFGFLHILKALKTSIQLVMLLCCVNQNIQNSGLDALLSVSLFDSARKGILTVMDSHLIMEDNIKMRAVMERMNHEVYKKYRIFEKAL